MPNPRNHARGLLKKAAEDLKAADLIIDNDGPISMVCFHAQQAAEVRYDPEFDPETEQAVEALNTAHEMFALVSAFVNAED